MAMNSDTPSSKSTSDPALSMALVALSLGVGAILFAGIDGHRYMPDSWLYYELSEGFFTDFYRTWLVRSYLFDQKYSAAFPPLYPLAIALVDNMTGLGWRAGMVLNVASFIGFFWFNAAIARELCGRWSPGIVASLASLTFLPFGEELISGRTHPTALMIQAAIVWMIVRTPTINLGTAALLGVLSGLSIMTRFDFAIPAVLIAGLLLVWTLRISVAIVYSLMVCLMVSPWIWYSATQFGTFFITDNSWVASAADGRYSSSDYVDPPGPPRIRNVTELFHKLVAQSNVMFAAAKGIARHLAPAFLALIAGIAAYRIWSGAWPRGRFVMFPPGFGRPAALILAWLGVVPGAWLCGYSDIRYLTSVVWQVWLLLFCLVPIILEKINPEAEIRLFRIFAGTFAIVAMALAVYLRVLGGLSVSAADQRSREIAECLQKAGGTTSDTVLFSSGLMAGQFTALAHWAAAYPPHNGTRLTAEQFGRLIQRFGVRFVEGDHPQVVGTLVEPMPIPGCPVTIRHVKRN